ncbi:MAG TPA: LamG-like jellyroll fold domain-containing protein [Bryobacteraceae bacterium]|nr:LamG-like jellyroll fold domain-containing protein [Bryobacteraceae bacterium]
MLPTNDPVYVLIRAMVLVCLSVYCSNVCYAAAPGLVAAYAFDENAGIIASDASGNANAGTVLGTTWVAGKYGSSLRFNGTSALVRVPDSNSLDVTSAFTLEAWVYPTASNSWRTVVMKEALSGLAYAIYSHNNSNRPAGYVSIGNSDQAANGSAALALNTWSHVAMTYNGSTMRLYVNGVQRGSRAIAGAVPVTSGGLSIGGNTVWGEYFAGSIDELRIYNRMLSVAEITTDMNTPISASGPSITMTAPANGSLVSGTITLRATASAPAGVVGVQFKVDGNNLGGEVTTPPYQMSWNTTSVSDGAHTLAGVIRDTAGATSTSPSISVSVGNITSPPLLPSVSIATPIGGATVAGNVSITASAQNAVGVQFLVDGTNVGAEDTTSPYSVTWNTSSVSDGNHTITARARNAAGTTISSPIAVTVANANPSISGSWSPLINLPIVPVHSVLLHTGKILMFDRPSAGPTARVWDPIANTFTSVPNNTTDLFCAGHSAMADGRILVVGGHGGVEAGTSDVNIFDPVALTWTLVSRMAYKRWYPNTTTLPDGRVLAATGAATTVTDYVTIPEIYNPATNVWTRLTTASADLAQYGHLFLLPNGKVAYTGNWEFPGDARVLDLSTNTWTTVDPNITDGYSVMYEPGKVLKCGSSSDSGLPGVSVNTCNTIDFTSATPRWQTAALMANARTHHNMTILPDGNVFVSGGSRMKDGYNTNFSVYQPEMWSPVTQTFTAMAPNTRPRLYHSETVLLPDGRIISMGGGRDGTGIDQLNAEIYSPPYLFKGTRPVIGAAPSVVTYGESVTVTTADAASIATVVMMRPGSPTHGFDMDQRRIVLPFQAGSNSLTVQAPVSAAIAPPGYYMLFLVNSVGVPSVASFIRVSPANQGTPPGAPASLTATGAVGTVSLTWQASTSPSGIANYNVHRSTTPGFVPTTANRIAQPTAASYTDASLSAGRYYYLVTATDANGLTSGPSNEVFGDVLADTIPPQITMTSPVVTTVSGVVTVAATATDSAGIAGVQFLLDGSPLGAEITSSPYSTQWNSAVATNGTHTLSARARDVGGNTATATALTVTVQNTTPTGLVAAYSFSEGTGPTTVDRSGTGSNGTLVGALWTTSGKFGNALSFNGSARVTVPDSSSLDLTTGMTLMAWISPTTSANWRTVLLKETANDLAYALYASNDTNRPGVWINTTSTQSVTGPAQIPVNTWIHLAATYDGATLRLYVNGAQASSRAVTQSMLVSTGPLQIGGNAIWGEYFSGLIDEVRVYNRALTSAEITNAMNTAIAP